MVKEFFLFCVCLLCFFQCSSVKRAIVIGATSGMGRQVAKLLARDYEVGLVGRRLELLLSLQNEIPTKTYIKQIDVSRVEESMTLLKELIEEMGGLDLIVISVSAGNDKYQKHLDRLRGDKMTLDVDLRGFWAMAHVAVEYFEQQGVGHLVGISSISGVRGEATGPVYCGAKAFVSRYLEGVRNYMIQKNIHVYVTDIVPGWVDTEAATPSQRPGTYWVVPAQVAAQQIYEAIKAKKKVAYITKRQVIVAWLLMLTPDWIYNRVGGF